MNKALFIAKYALAQAQFEGYFKRGSIAARHNNPGNLRPVGASRGFRTFNNPADGWSAMKAQILRNFRRQLTVWEFFAGKPGVYPGYAPISDNPGGATKNYATYVANRVGLSLDDRPIDVLNRLPE